MYRMPQYTLSHSVEPMVTAKSTTLTFRIDPALKDALRIAAQQADRSLSKIVETLIREPALVRA